MSAECAEGAGSAAGGSRADGVTEASPGVVEGASGMTLQMMQGASMISFGPVYTSSGTLTSPGGSAPSDVPPVSRTSLPWIKPRSSDQSL